MDIVQHLIEMTTTNNKTPEFKPREYKKNYEFAMMERQQRQMNRRKPYKIIRTEPETNIIFQQSWDKLNKYQQLNRIILYANKNMNPDEKQNIIKLFENRKIKVHMVDYDIKLGSISSINIHDD